MKAIVQSGLYPNYGDSRFEYNVDFFNSDGKDGSSLEVHIPLSNITDDENLRTYVKNVVITEATNRSYSGFTEDSILWDSPSLLNNSGVDALKGYTTSTINGKSVGNTTVFTNNSGKDFLVTEYWIHPITVTGLGTAPVINIGKTASAYNDIDSSLSLSIAPTAGRYSKQDSLSNSVKVANGESVVVRVATAAILTTTYDFQVIVRGVYLS